MGAWEPGDWIALAGVVAAALVGLGSLVFSFFTVRHNRAESYRAALYTRQLQDVVELARTLSALHAEVLKHLEAGVPPDAVEEIVAGPLDELRRARITTAAVLPNAVLDAALTYETKLDSTLSSAWAGGDRVLLLDAMFIRFVELVRSELGIDELGDRIRQLTGVEQRERKRHFVAELDAEIRGIRESPSD